MTTKCIKVEFKQSIIVPAGREQEAALYLLERIRYDLLVNRQAMVDLYVEFRQVEVADYSDIDDAYRDEEE